MTDDIRALAQAALADAEVRRGWGYSGMPATHVECSHDAAIETRQRTREPKLAAAVIELTEGRDNWKRIALEHAERLAQAERELQELRDTTGVTAWASDVRLAAKFAQERKDAIDAVSAALGFNACGDLSILIAMAESVRKTAATVTSLTEIQDRNNAINREAICQRDAARAEVERLTACLGKANANHEDFERRWYLATDERDRLAAELAEMRPVCEAAETWDADDETGCLSPRAHIAPCQACVGCRLGCAVDAWRAARSKP